MLPVRSICSERRASCEAYLFNSAGAAVAGVAAADGPQASPPVTVPCTAEGSPCTTWCLQGGGVAGTWIYSLLLSRRAPYTESHWTLRQRRRPRGYPATALRRLTERPTGLQLPQSVGLDDEAASCSPLGPRCGSQGSVWDCQAQLHRDLLLRFRCNDRKARRPESSRIVAAHASAAKMQVRGPLMI